MCVIARHKFQVLSLYRMLMRESKKFPAYNFRMYFMRRIREQFRENQFLKEPEQISQQFKYGEDTLQLIRRQVIIGHLYGCDKLAVEK
ncbi:protein bcn92 [Episyrphus balteatus]|uniref:protein bcn92 n=1 Tax=Episyrphus balteatus TaxID=286459 RepID=UPI002485A683|nr:protein bcn92 [Episyrphus balteatus]